jgi:hypothetical protein
MKRVIFLLAMALMPALVLAQSNALIYQQRKADDSGFVYRTATPPSSHGFFYSDNLSKIPRWGTFGSTCTVTLGVLDCASSITLSGTSNNEGVVMLGATSGVATGTGTSLTPYKNNLGGGLVVGVSVTSNQANSYTVNVPTGWYFAVRQTSGTGLQVVSTFEQAY